MDKKKDLEKILKASGHKMPVTRREFIGLGLVQGASYVAMPNLLGILFNEKTAQGADLCSAVGNGMPYITFDFAGGDLSPQVWTALNAGGEPLQNQDTFALGTNATPLDNRFGLPMNMANGQNTAAFYNAFMAALNTQVNGAGMSAAEINNIVKVGIANVTNDDTNANVLNPDGLLTAAGHNGQLFQALGRGNSRSAATVATVAVNSVQDVLNAVNLGPLAGVSSAQKAKLMRTVSNLNSSQLSQLSKMSLWDQLSGLLGCATIKTGDLLQNPATGVDPRTVAAVQQIYGINAASNNEDARQAAIVYNCLMGNSGPGTITIGGFDSHGQGQTAQDAVMANGGRAIRLAAALGKRFMFAKVSDGSGAGSGGSVAWNADSGVRGMTIIGTFNPAGRAQLKTKMIGNFTAGQVVDPTTFFGNQGNSNLIPYVILANWLNLQGSDLLAKKFPTSIFPTSDLLEKFTVLG